MGWSQTGTFFQEGNASDPTKVLHTKGSAPNGTEHWICTRVRSGLDRLGPAKEVAHIGAAVGREFSALLPAVVRKPEAIILQ